jgi:hypothetical protein
VPLWTKGELVSVFGRTYFGFSFTYACAKQAKTLYHGAILEYDAKMNPGEPTIYDFNNFDFTGEAFLEEILPNIVVCLIKLDFDISIVLGSNMAISSLSPPVPYSLSFTSLHPSSHPHILFFQHSPSTFQAFCTSHHILSFQACSLLVCTDKCSIMVKMTRLENV